MTTPTTVQVQIQLRADTAANWASENPTLLANEVGLETDTKKLKVGDGTTAWNTLAYFPSIVSGGTVLGNLEIGTTGTLTFEGSTADGFETTLAVTDPTADRTITLPDQSGTVVVTGNASIVDADIAANAEIAVSKLADGAARQLLQTDATGTGVEWTDNVDVPGTLDVTGVATFDANVTIEGDLTVNGTTTTIDTETLLVKDKNIELAVVDTPTDTTADGGGITLKGATDKTITWSNTSDSWEFNQPTVTTGNSSAAAFVPTGSTVPSNGVYLPSANNVAISTNGAQRATIDADGRSLVGTAAAITTATSSLFQVSDAVGARVVLGRTDTTVVAGNRIGELRFFSNGGDGNYGECSAILCEATDDDHTTSSKPSALILKTTPVGAATAQERLRIDSSGRLLVGTSSDSGGALLQVNGNRVRIATAKTPASASDTGTAGEICWDANYIYVCTATNTWKRTAIATW